MSMLSTSVLRGVDEISQGPTLHDLMAQGKRPSRDLLVDWGCQLLDILAKAHAAGVVHRHVSEEDIVVTPDGRLVLRGFGRPQIHGDPSTLETDLLAVGLLLRRLAFASGLRGERGLGAPRRDPLLKVLARASFPNPAARFRDAREMADALRQAGRAGSPARPSRPARSASPAGPLPITAQNIARIPAARPEPRKEVQDDSREDRKLALLLLTAAMILMLMLVAAGWFLIRRDGVKAPVLPAGAATSVALRTPGPG